MEYEYKVNLAREMENFHKAVIEPYGRIGISTSLHPERGLKVLVAVPPSVNDSALCGNTLSEPSLSGDWLNPDEDEA